VGLHKVAIMGAEWRVVVVKAIMGETLAMA
jgi:hypothetical protein